MINKLLDVRKLRRAVDLISSDDPDQAASQLQSVLNEALIAYSSGNRGIQSSAVNELKNIKAALMAQQINAGKKSANFASAYQIMIEKFETELENNNTQNSGIRDSFSSITKNLPTADTITTALTTANPILGYGVKMITDVGRKSVESFNSARADQQRRQQLIEQEKLELSKIIDTPEESDSEVFEDEQNILKQIQENTLALVRIWDESGEVLSDLEKVNQEAIELEKQRIRDEELRRIESERAGDNTQALPAPANEKLSQKDDGFGSDILAGLGLGIGAGGIKGIFRSFGSIIGAFKPLVAVAGKVLLIGAIVSSLVDFVDGFYEAGKFFDGEIGIKERVISGVASILSGLVSMVDSVLEFFNIDIISMDKDQLTQATVDFYKASEAAVVDLYDSSVENVKKVVSSVKELFTNTIDSVMNFFDSILGNIKEAIEAPKKLAKEKINDIKSFFGFGNDDEIESKKPIQTRDDFERSNINGSSAILSNEQKPVSSTQSTILNAPVSNVVNNSSATYTTGTSAKNNDSNMEYLRRARLSIR